jgi:hypothetical protein
VKRSHLTFSFLLPLVSLSVWLVLVAVPATIGYLRLLAMAHGASAVHLQAGQFSTSVPRDGFLWFSIRGIGIQRSDSISALNMPGLFGELLISLPTSWPASWHPAGWDIKSWRTLVMPFFCLPAWFFVGRGIDALLGWRRLHWGTLLAGTLLCVLFLVLFLGLRFGLSSDERCEVVFPLWGMFLWAFLFAVVPAAWIRQWRTRDTSSPAKLKS